jgi:hypothetical protein
MKPLGVRRSDSVISAAIVLHFRAGLGLLFDCIRHR